MKAPVSDDRGLWTSASNAEADELCQGRHQAHSVLPDTERDEDSDAGTRIHAWLAAMASGETLPPLSDDDLEIAEKCWAYAQAEIENWSDGLPVTLNVEHRCWAVWGSIQHSGKADLVASVQEEHGVMKLIMDYKTGRGSVEEPAKNMQLRDLAALQPGFPLSVTVQIIQPLAGKSTPCVYDFEDLKRATADMKNRVLASNAPNATRVAGEVQCKYCRAKRTCPEYAMQLAMVPTTSLSEMQPADLGKVLAICRDVGEKAEEEVRRLLDLGIEVPGWTLVPGHTTSKIKSPEGVWTKCDAIGVKASEFMSAVTVHKTPLKTVVKKATGLKGKALDEALASVLEGNVDEKVGSPRLERE